MKEKQRIIATPRLTMKPLEDGDRAALLRICGDERVKSTYMLPDFPDAARAEAFFRRLQALSARRRHTCRPVTGIQGAAFAWQGRVNRVGIAQTAPL